MTRHAAVVAGVHGKMTPVFHLLWVPSALCESARGAAYCETIHKGVRPLPGPILAVRGLRKFHMRGIFIIQALTHSEVWRHRPATQSKLGFKAFNVEKTYYSLESVSAIVCSLNFKTGKKRVNILWAKFRCLCMHVFLLLSLLKSNLVAYLAVGHWKANGSDRNQRQEASSRVSCSRAALKKCTAGVLQKDSASESTEPGEQETQETGISKTPFAKTHGLAIPQPPSALCNRTQS